MLQKCSNMLKCQSLVSSRFHGTFPRGKCGRASAAIFPPSLPAPGGSGFEPRRRTTSQHLDQSLARIRAQIAAATAGRSSFGAACWSGARPGYRSLDISGAISSKSGQSKEIARNSSLRWTRFPMFRRKRAMNCRSESERIFCFAQADGMEALDPPEVGAGPFAGTKSRFVVDRLDALTGLLQHCGVTWPRLKGH